MVFIDVKGARKEFNIGVSIIALKDVTFSVEQGEFVGIMGPSGSGKSTLLNIVGGLEQLDGGAVTVDDMDIYDTTSATLANYRREYVGFIFQQFHLIPTLTAVENVCLPLMLSGLPGDEQLERAREVLDWVGLKGLEDRLPHQLSGGEQQRVAIARATVNEPLILLADEPTGNLDSTTGEEIMKLLRRLNDKGTTILFVTHDQRLGAEADRIVRIKDGVAHE
ncbi:MAG: ABC transporter ATP-binding protein [Candidatus Undinarchaeales archaeon]|jgi:putative ABC transport system ATP-binding protein|nr:ABC transporter ATP-binding protein [Candidatus Undinarchaeales archaeon]